MFFPYTAILDDSPQIFELGLGERIATDHMPGRLLDITQIAGELNREGDAPKSSVTLENLVHDRAAGVPSECYFDDDMRRLLIQLYTVPLMAKDLLAP